MMFLSAIYLNRLERKTRKRKKVLATLKVLWSVIEDMTKEISPEDAKSLISEEVWILILGILLFVLDFRKLEKIYLFFLYPYIMSNSLST